MELLVELAELFKKLYTAMDANADVFIYPYGHISDIPDLDFPYEMVVVKNYRRGGELAT